MSIIRTVFLGTPEIADHCLNSMLKDEHFRIVGVVSQPDRPSGRKMKPTPSPVKQTALAHGIPVITPEKITESELEVIKSWGAEAAVVVAFGQILKQEFLDMYPRKVVNVHASLLPRWRGAAPIQRAIMAGDSLSGVCLQVMVKKLDAGDVVGLREMAIDSQINALEMHDAMKEKAAELLEVEFMDYLRGNLVPQVQDESKVTYAHKIEKSESLIDWSESAEFIHNQIRGLALGPGAHTLKGGKKLKIHSTQALAGSDKNEPPGTVVKLDKDFLVVQCGQGQLKVLELQPESKPKMPTSQYLLGNSLQLGDVFGK